MYYCKCFRAFIHLVPFYLLNLLISRRVRSDSAQRVNKIVHWSSWRAVDSCSHSMCYKFWSFSLEAVIVHKRRYKSCGPPTCSHSHSFNFLPCQRFSTVVPLQLFTRSVMRSTNQFVYLYIYLYLLMCLYKQFVYLYVICIYFCFVKYIFPLMAKLIEKIPAALHQFIIHLFVLW